MIVELICSSSSFSKGMIISSSTGGSSCLLVSAVGVSGTEVSEEGATAAGISGSGNISFASESGLERETDNIVHINKYSKGMA